MTLESFFKNGIEVGLWTGTLAEIALMVQLYVFEGRAFQLRFDTTLHLIESSMAFIVFYFLAMATMYSVLRHRYMKEKIVRHTKKHVDLLRYFLTWGVSK